MTFSQARLLGVVAVLCFSCKEGAEDEDDDTSEFSECGDPDGSGGDTGNVPNVLGAWTVTFGSNIYDDNACDAPGLTSDDLSEPLGGAMYIEGRIPDQLYAVLGIRRTLLGLRERRGRDRLYGRDHQGGPHPLCLLWRTHLHAAAC